MLFRCLRLEMQALFRNAVERLPRMERLFVTLNGYEHLTDEKSISVVLAVPEAAISGIRKAAHLHIRAALPNPELHFRRRPTHAPLANPAWDEASTCYRLAKENYITDLADVNIYGSQSGLLSDQEPRQPLADCSWESFRSWYAITEDHRLVQTWSPRRVPSGSASLIGPLIKPAKETVGALNDA